MKHHAGALLLGLSIVATASAQAYEDLPTCGDVAGGQDCKIDLADGALVFAFGPGSPSTLMISQADARGAWIAKVPPFDIVPADTGAVAMDVTGDGSAEIFQPLQMDGTPATYVAMGRDDLGRFETWGTFRAGAIADVSWSDGVLRSSWQEGDGARIEAAWHRDQGALQLVYEIASDSCSLTQGPGWDAGGGAMDPVVRSCSAAPKGLD